MVSLHNGAALGRQDVEVSHDDMLVRVCWATRALVMVVSVLLPAANLVMSSLGHRRGEVYEHVTALCAGSVCLAATVRACACGWPPAREVGTTHSICCLAMVVVSAMQMVVSAELHLHDLLFQLVIRPCISFMMMSLRTVLEVGGGWRTPDLFWMMGCAAFNSSMVYECYLSLPSLLPLCAGTIALQVFVALLLESTMSALLREREALKAVKKVLQHNLDAQDTMWRSVFDATCTLDSSGRIVRTSPQALDLLEAESPESVVGVSPSQMASTASEVERLSDFLRGACEASSNQAFTIQSTIVTGKGSRIDVQLNAVKVIHDASDLASPSAAGLLLGLRAAAPACGGVGARSPDPPPPPQRAVDGGDGPERGRDMFIRFDAGRDGFEVAECTGDLWDMKPRLLDWLPRPAKDGFESWVIQEVQGSDDGGGISEGAVDNLELRIQRPPLTVSARRAWLQTLPVDLTDAGVLPLPAVLWLRGVHIQRPLRTRAPAAEVPALSTVPEGAGEGSRDMQDGAASDFSITPSESASQAGGAFRVRALTPDVGPTFRSRSVMDDP